jgi:hypothetical protein
LAFLSKSELVDLMENPGDRCVSIYMPTQKAGAETQQNAIRLKNLLKEAEEKLSEAGMRSVEAREMLKPAEDLLQREEFWQHQEDGLALFIAPGSFKTYRLSREFEELVMVAENFYVKPLLPLLTTEGRFFVLTLSQGGVKLLEGDRSTLTEVNVDELPDNLADALRFDDPEKQLQWHTGTATPAGQGDRPAMFHGHGVGDEDEKERIQRYFQKIASALQDTIAAETRPLVLVGLDFLLPIYRQVNRYPHLVEEGITINPEVLNQEELHSRAWEVVEPFFTQKREEALDRFRISAGRGSEQASTNLEEIVQAAYGKRVETLFVPLGGRQWGRYDLADNKVELHNEPQAGDEDLLDFAIQAHNPEWRRSLPA